MTLQTQLSNIWPYLSSLLEIGILWIGLYYLMRLLRGTRGAQVMSGLVSFIALMLVATRFLNLYTLNWLFTQFSLYIVIAFIVIFQPEIRGVLAALGRRKVFVNEDTPGGLVQLVGEMTDAVCQMAEGKIGAIIAIERESGMRSHQETGRPINADLSSELLRTIFFPRSPLHDGGVIIKDGRIAAAGCVFPLTQREDVGKALGTRHRAAIGVTEETDALVVVVSEETGTISVAYRGRIVRGLDRERLHRILLNVLRRRGNVTIPQIQPTVNAAAAVGSSPEAELIPAPVMQEHKSS